MTTIVSVTPINSTVREVEVVTANPTATYRREQANGAIAWYTWDGVTKTYMTTEWRPLEALFQGH